jgi:hypothetical protein
LRIATIVATDYTETQKKFGAKKFSVSAEMLRKVLKSTRVRRNEEAMKNYCREQKNFTTNPANTN